MNFLEKNEERTAAFNAIKVIITEGDNLRGQERQVNGGCLGWWEVLVMCGVVTVVISGSDNAHSCSYNRQEQNEIT